MLMAEAGTEEAAAAAAAEVVEDVKLVCTRVGIGCLVTEGSEVGLKFIVAVKCRENAVANKGGLEVPGIGDS